MVTRARRYCPDLSVQHVKELFGVSGENEQIGGKPRDWKHIKGIGTLEYKGRTRNAEVHWFEAAGQPKVKFKVKEWLS